MFSCVIRSFYPYQKNIASTAILWEVNETVLSDFFFLDENIIDAGYSLGAAPDAKESFKCREVGKGGLQWAATLQDQRDGNKMDSSGMGNFFGASCFIKFALMREH